MHISESSTVIYFEHNVALIVFRSHFHSFCLMLRWLCGFFSKCHYIQLLAALFQFNTFRPKHGHCIQLTVVAIIGIYLIIHLTKSVCCQPVSALLYNCETDDVVIISLADISLILLSLPRTYSIYHCK
jgi:hypothetical protein